MTEHDDTRPDVTDIADADLVLRTRAGDADAYAELWRRHYRSGIVVANSITSAFDADDLVQESYARIYQTIQRGGGPTGAFRAYLFTSIRNTAARWGQARRETSADELESVADPDAEAHATDEALDRSLTTQAFRSLPTRWQEVLWYTEIEQMKPWEVAPLLGMKATAVAQLAFRAREGLREAWVQGHLRAAPAESECRWTIEHLGAYARGNLGRRDVAKIEAHLAGCTRCTIVAAEAQDVSRRLALILLPLTLGAGGATAYLATLQGGSAPIVALAAGVSPVMPDTVLTTGTGGLGGTTGAAGGVAGTGGAAGGVVGAAAASGAPGSVGALVGVAAAAVLVVGGVATAVVVPQLVAQAETTASTSADAGRDTDAAADASSDDDAAAPVASASPQPS
ncbi:MAG: hypothetical protein ABS63_00875, partial [Microbacterium sp. SCN 70-27]